MYSAWHNVIALRSVLLDTSEAWEVATHRTADLQTMVASSFMASSAIARLVLKHTVASLLGSTPLAFVEDTAYLGEVADWVAF